jgi:hypothetical protein
MKLKATFWTLGYALPIATIAGLLISLRIEHASLEARVTRMQTAPARIELQSPASTEQTRDIEANKAVNNARMKKDSTALTPAQKRWLDLVQTWAQIKAKSGTANQGTQSAEPPYPPTIFYSISRPYFPQLLGNPDYDKAASILMKQIVEEKYGRLFATLQLSPGDQDKLADLVAQRDMLREDAVGLMGRDVDPALRAAVNNPTAREISSEIRTTFGAKVAQQVQTYAGLVQFYTVTDAMEARLSFTPTPLQPAQADQLVGMLSGALGRISTKYFEVPDSVVEQSASVLSAPQIAVLRQLQEELTTRLQVREARQAAADNTP